MVVLRIVQRVQQRDDIVRLQVLSQGRQSLGRLAGEFIRTKIVPELDAYRIAKYASTVGISKAIAALTTGAAVIAALRVAADALNEDEVGADERYLFKKAAFDNWDINLIAEMLFLNHLLTSFNIDFTIITKQNRIW